MPDSDAFETAYRRLDATRLAAIPSAPPAPPQAGRIDTSSPARWAKSSLVRRIQVLAPKPRSPRRHGKTGG